MEARALAPASAHVPVRLALVHGGRIDRVHGEIARRRDSDRVEALGSMYAGNRNELAEIARIPLVPRGLGRGIGVHVIAHVDHEGVLRYSLLVARRPFP